MLLYFVYENIDRKHTEIDEGNWFYNNISRTNLAVSI